MTKSVEGTAQRRKLLGEIERLAEIAVLERSRKLIAPADEQAATAKEMGPSMVRI